MRVDLATKPSTDELANEDFAAASADVVLVLDGVTPLDRTDTGCRHGVAWFARTLGGTLLAHASGTGMPLTECLANAITRVADYHRDDCDLSHPDSPASTVTAIRARAGQLDYLVLADSPLVIDHGTGTEVVEDHRPAQTGRRVRTENPGLASQQLARAVRAHRNQDDGYGVVTDDPAATAHAITGNVALGEVRHVVLATDGAARLVAPLGVTDWATGLEILANDGAAGWLAWTRAAEIEDATARHTRGEPPRTKIHDDATLAYVTALTSHPPHP